MWVQSMACGESSAAATSAPGHSGRTYTWLVRTRVCVSIHAYGCSPYHYLLLLAAHTRACLFLRSACTAMSPCAPNHDSHVFTLASVVAEPTRMGGVMSPAAWLRLGEVVEQGFCELSVGRGCAVGVRGRGCGLGGMHGRQ